MDLVGLLEQPRLSRTESVFRLEKRNCCPQQTQLVAAILRNASPWVAMVGKLVLHGHGSKEQVLFQVVSRKIGQNFATLTQWMNVSTTCQDQNHLALQPKKLIQHVQPIIFALEMEVITKLTNTELLEANMEFPD